MNLLLDTHTLLWLVSTPTNIDSDALAILRDPRTSIFVSAASAWEIAVKTQLGRLDGSTLLSAWADIISDMDVTDLSIDAADAILAARLPWNHRDPFDRMIVAQALRSNLTIATRDAQIISAASTPTLSV